MGELHRRGFLTSAGTAAIAAALPIRAVPALSVVAPVVAPMPTWIVGTPGESDHYVIRALTQKAAIRFRAEECEIDPADDDFISDGSCECCACTANAGYEATRVVEWDGRQEDKITGGDWVAAGFESTCERCSYECSQDGGGASVNGEAVCGECMTLADWEVVNPEYAAEMRADLEDARP